MKKIYQTIMALSMLLIAHVVVANTATAPDGYLLKLKELTSQKTSQQPVRAMAAADVDDVADVLLIQTAPPWDSNANTEVLDQLGFSYTIKDFNGLSDYDIGEHQVVLIVNDQVQAFYDQYAQNYSLFVDYVENGGTLVFFACDEGWANGDNYTDLPGGVEVGDSYDNTNYFVVEDHPIVTGELNQQNPRTSLTQDELESNYASHNYIIESTLPNPHEVIFRTTSNDEPTLVSYRLGRGNVIASGLTWEHSYKYQDNVETGSYGRALPDVFLYAFSLSGGVQTSDLLEVYPDDNRSSGQRPATLKMPGQILDVVARVDFSGVELSELGDTMDIVFSFDSSIYESVDAATPLLVFERSKPSDIAIGQETPVEGFTVTNPQSGVTEVSVTGYSLANVQQGDSLEFVFRGRLSKAQASRAIDVDVSLQSGNFEDQQALARNGLVSVGLSRILLTNRGALYQNYVAPGGHYLDKENDAIEALWQSVYEVSAKQNVTLAFVDKWDRDYDGEDENPTLTWLDDRKNLPYDGDVNTGYEEGIINSTSEHVASYLKQQIELSGGIGRGRHVAILGGDNIVPMYRAYDSFLTFKDTILDTASYFPSNRGFYATAVFAEDSKNGMIHTDGRYHTLSSSEDWKSGNIEEIYIGRVLGFDLHSILSMWASSTSEPVSTENVIMLENMARNLELTKYHRDASNAGFNVVAQVDGINLDTAPAGAIYDGLGDGEFWPNDDAAGLHNLFLNIFSGNEEGGVGAFSVWRSMTHGDVNGIYPSFGDYYIYGSFIDYKKDSISTFMESFQPVFIFDACLVGQVDGSDPLALLNSLMNVGIGAAIAPSIVTYSFNPADISQYNDEISEKLFRGDTVGKAKQSAFGEFSVPFNSMDDLHRLGINLYGVPWRKVAPAQVQPQRTLAAPVDMGDSPALSVYRQEQPGAAIQQKAVAAEPLATNLVIAESFGELSATITADDDTGYSIVEVDDSDFSLDITDAHTPILPYKLFQFKLPIGAEVSDVRFSNVVNESLGQLSIPGFIRNLELPGVPFGEFTDLLGFGIFPVNDLSYDVASTARNVVVNVPFYPVQYNADTQETTLRKSGAIEVVFSSPFLGLVEVVEADRSSYVVGSTINVTALVQNTYDLGVDFSHAVTIYDAFGNEVVGEASALEFIEPGQKLDIWVATVAPTEVGLYKVVSLVTDANGAVIADQEQDIYVTSGELTSFVGPNRLMYEQSGFFSVAYQNFKQASTSVRVNIGIKDADNNLVIELPQRVMTVAGASTDVLDVAWTPTDALQAGAYEASVKVVDANNQVSYAESSPFIVNAGQDLFANAGDDRIVSQGQVAVLDGSNSYSMSGDIAFQWSFAESSNGMNFISIDGDNSSLASLELPYWEGDDVVEIWLKLTVEDGINPTSEDIVKITALPAEFNGSPPVGFSFVEYFGYTQLLRGDDGYYVADESRPLSWQGVQLGELPGWTYLGAEVGREAAYDVFVRNDATGEYVRWGVDENGAIQTGEFLTAVDVQEYEASFAQDLDGDGFTGVPEAEVYEEFGSVKLLYGSGGYYIDDESRPLSWQGDHLGALPGWTYLGAEYAQGQDATYDVFVKNDATGEYVRWGVDANGAIQTGEFLTADQVAGYEVAFDQDLNGDGYPGIKPIALTELEGAGAVSLLYDDDGYFYVGDQSRPLSWQGDHLGALPGWTYLGAEAGRDAAYDVFVKNDATGEYVRWGVDAHGAIQTGEFLTADQVAGYEVAFDQDLNGDGYPGIKPITLTELEDAGAVSLLYDDDGYFYVGDQSRPLSWQGDHLGALPGWTYLGAEAGRDAAYDVFVKNDATGEYVRWGVDAHGAIQTGEFLTADQVAGYEVAFDQDLNGDGYPGIKPITLTELEDAGAVSLLYDDDGYFYVGDQSRPLSWQGDHLGALPGWTYLGAEAGRDAAYDVFVKNVATGEFVRWGVDERGAIQVGEFLTAEQVIAYEVAFDQDLNGDGWTGRNPNEFAWGDIPAGTILESYEEYTFIREGGYYISFDRYRSEVNYGTFGYQKVSANSGVINAGQDTSITQLGIEIDPPESLSAEFTSSNAVTITTPGDSYPDDYVLVEAEQLTPAAINGVYVEFTGNYYSPQYGGGSGSTSIEIWNNGNQGTYFGEEVVDFTYTYERVGPRECRIIATGWSDEYQTSFTATYLLFFLDEDSGYGLAIEQFGDGTTEYEWGTFDAYLPLQ